MRDALRVVVGSALVLAAVLATGALTRYEYGAGLDRSALRLAWRLSVPRVVECREPTAAEQRELPAHMRQDEICEGRPVPYALEVAVDGDVRYRTTVGAEGVRGDRPLQIFHELALDPGTRDIRVEFARADSAGGETDAPDRLVLERELRVEPGDVVLVTYDPDRRALMMRGAAEVRGAPEPTEGAAEPEGTAEPEDIAEPEGTAEPEEIAEPDG